MDFIQQQLIDPVSNLLWTYVLIYVLLGVGLYFGIRTRFVQVRLFGRMLRQITSSRSGSEGGISSFQAFCVGLASRVGTGNIAGVALALTLGGARGNFLDLEGVGGGKSDDLGCGRILQKKNN